MATYDEVVETIKSETLPTPEEREILKQAVEKLKSISQEATNTLPFETSVLHLGSTSRNTWLREDIDIDIFIQFPLSVSKKDLEKYGLEVGHEILENGHEEYADHPYVKGKFEEFDVDIVPCYSINSSKDIVSAVDRTPLHGIYLSSHITEELTDEIRVFKKFLKNCGIYGSDLKTQGVSGYLAELLIIMFGGFKQTIEEVSQWGPSVRLDMENHSSYNFESPLTLIDPIDPTRNVAAALSTENFSRLQHCSRDFLSDPRVDFFNYSSAESITPDELKSHIKIRGTSLLSIIFTTPSIVDDELYPQLQKSLSGISDLLRRQGFQIIRKHAFSRSDTLLFFELASLSIPSIELHEGPPLSSKEHASIFFNKYISENVYGPFIIDDHYAVERPREFNNAVSLLKSEKIFTARMGPDIEQSLKTQYSVISGDEILTLTTQFGLDLKNYFNPFV